MLEIVEYKWYADYPFGVINEKGQEIAAFHERTHAEIFIEALELDAIQTRAINLFEYHYDS